jgi:hypothetical protein
VPFGRGRVMSTEPTRIYLERTFTKWAGNPQGGVTPAVPNPARRPQLYRGRLAGDLLLPAKSGVFDQRVTRGSLMKGRGAI